MREIIAGLDIGSNTIKLVVAEIIKGKLNILCCCENKSKGIKKGLVVNPEELSVVLKSLFKKCEEIIGTKISKIILCVPSYGAEFLMGEGYTTINREENKVLGEDILRTLQSSVYNKVLSNKELISIMPLEFKLDDKLVTNDPKGKVCSKLSVKTLISLVPKKSTFGLLSVLESMNITAVDLCFNTMADFYEFRNADNKDKLGAVINIGSEKTEVGIINKGILVAVDSLFYGGKNIDRDISYIYNISRSDAKRLKERFALAHKANASTSETEEVITKDGENIKVNQYEISEIVYSRIKEILDFAKKQINILTKREISYIIITGGTTEISDFQKVLDESFNKNVVLQEVTEIGVRNNKYSSVLGFIKYYHSKLNFKSKVASTLTEEEQSGLFNKKKKINDGNLLGKIYGYFFDN